MYSSYLSELEHFLAFFSGIGLIISIFIIYLVLSIWYNTRQNKKNTDKIVELLKDYMFANSIKISKEEPKEDWIYENKKEPKESIWTKKLF